MNLNTSFEFYTVIDGEKSHTIKEVFSWQEALQCFLDHCVNNGFEIDEKLEKQIVELAKFRRIHL